MGSTDNAAASAKLPRHSRESGNPAGQSEGLGPRVRGDDMIDNPTAYSSSGLSGSVGIGGANAPGDVFQVSSALTNNGLMDAPQEIADNTLFSGIISAQENMDSSLKRDGLVNPDGPTQQKFSRLAGQGFVKAPAPAAPPPPLPPLPQGEGRGEGANSRTPLSDEAIQSNQRLATALTRRTDVGDLPRFTTDAINTDATKAIPEIVDLIREVETSDPKQAHQLYQQTLEGIAPENQRRLEDTYALSLSGGSNNGDGGPATATNADTIRPT